MKGKKFPKTFYVILYNTEAKYNFYQGIALSCYPVKFLIDE